MYSKCLQVTLSMSLCLSVHSHITKTTRPDFTKFSSPATAMMMLVLLLVAVTRSRTKLAGDTSLMTYRGHCVLNTLVRSRFSPAFNTGQRYIYVGCATGAVVGNTTHLSCQHLLCVTGLRFITARRSYASAVLEVVILSVWPSVCHTRALLLCD